MVPVNHIVTILTLTVSVTRILLVIDAKRERTLVNQTLVKAMALVNHTQTAPDSNVIVLMDTLVNCVSQYWTFVSCLRVEITVLVYKTTQR